MIVTTVHDPEGVRTDEDNDEASPDRAALVQDVARGRAV